MLKNRRTERAISFDGQKSALPVEAYGFKSAQNVVGFVLKEGQLRRVVGGDTYADIIPGQPGGILSLHRFKNLWGAQRGTKIAFEDAEGAATFTDIFTGLESEDKFFSAQWRDRIFMVNGVEAKFLLNRQDDALSDTREAGNIGLDPPDGQDWVDLGGVTETDTGSGELVNGDYYYFLTVFDGETNSESPAAGAAVSVDGIFELSANAREANGTNFGPRGHLMIVVSGPSSVTFSKTQLHPYLLALQAENPRITDFSIYRGTLDPTSNLYSSLFAVPNIANSNQTINNIAALIADDLDFVDDTATADLPAIGLPTNNSPPPTMARLRLAREKMAAGGAFVSPFVEAENSGFRHIRAFRDQLFGFGAFSTGWDRSSEDFPTYDENGRNAFSGILFGSEVYQPDYFPYIWEVGRGDGQTAVGLGVLGDTALLLFKEKSTYYLSGSSPSDFVVRILDTNKGCVNESTIQETPIGVICLDRTGFVLFNKIGQGERISIEIQDIIDSIQFPYSASFYSFYDPKNQHYYCSVVVPGSQTPNLTLILDLDSMQWTTDTSIVGLSRLADTDSNGEYVELVGARDTGRLVSLSNPEIPTFQGQAVYSSWTSGALSFGDDQHKKKMRWLYLKVSAAGDWSATIQVIPDFDESRRYSIDVNYDSEQDTWYSSDASTDGSLIWDEGEWAFDGPERSQVKIPIICKGRLFQVRVINQDTAANRWGFAIEGISAEAVMLDK